LKWVRAWFGPKSKKSREFGSTFRLTSRAFDMTRTIIFTRAKGHGWVHPKHNERIQAPTGRISFESWPEWDIADLLLTKLLTIDEASKELEERATIQY
jgi:hypothetical protein